MQVGEARCVERQSSRGFLNFRVPTETLSKLCRKKGKIPGFFGHKAAIFRFLVWEKADFGPFNINRNVQEVQEWSETSRILCPSPWWSRVISLLSMSLLSGRSMNEHPWWYMILGVGGPGRAHIPQALPTQAPKESLRLLWKQFFPFFFFSENSDFTLTCMEEARRTPLVFPKDGVVIWTAVRRTPNWPWHQTPFLVLFQSLSISVGHCEMRVK